MQYFVFQGLIIYGIRIKNISSFAFWGLLRLKEVAMTFCHLSEPPSLALISSTLQKLNLGANNLTSFPPNYFDECKSLHIIEFGNNLLTSIPDIRNINATIKRILLGDNRITSIESLYFVPMPKLEFVDLRENLIMEIVFDNIRWPSITGIVLSKNCLTSLNIDGLKRVLGNVKITLEGNPWHCDLKICWLSHCNFRTGMRPGWGVWSECRGTESIKLVGDISCKSPDERKYQTIVETGK